MTPKTKSSASAKDTTTSTVAKGTKRPAPTEEHEDAPVLKKKAKSTSSQNAKATAEDDAEDHEESENVVKDVEPALNIAELVAQFVKNRQAQQALHKVDLEIIRNINKTHRKEVRLLAQSKSKKSRKGIKREPSGIATEKYVSPELCAFLGEPVGTRLPRTIVTKRMTAYVKSRDLLGREGHLKKNGEPSKQFITPNEELKALIGDPDDLNFFSLQTALNPHFVEPE